MLSLVVALALVATSCGDDDDGESASTSTGGSSQQATTTGGGTTTNTQATSPVSSEGSSEAAAPTRGGSVTFGEFAPPASFDPTGAAGLANGSVGGSELMALYDTVVLWDAQTKKYEGRTAKSFEPNADFTVWTLVLKDGIKFSDGTPYNAEAVKFNVERHMADTSRSQSRPVLLSFLKSMKVVDPLTLEFTLSRPWAGFPYLFSIDVGMIASPTAIQAAGATFGTNPGQAGAGPFVLKESRPGEAIVLERNGNYYGGDVYLDQVTFVPTAGQEAAYEAVKTGELDGAYFRSATAYADAPDDGLVVHSALKPAGNVIDINSGVYAKCQGGQPAACAGKADGELVKTTAPGSDARVRQAVALAIDADQVNQRTYDGAAAAGKDLFQSDIPLSPAVPGPTYDPDRAAQLVQEAKADGWDGSIRLYSVSDEVGQALGLSVSAMLTAAGMDVHLDTSFTPQTLLTKVLVNRDYDLVIWGSAFTENPDGNFVSFQGAFGSAASKGGFRGFSSEAMDAGIAALQVAGTDDAITKAYAMIAKAWNDEAPAVSLNQLQVGEITRPAVMGLQVTATETMVLDGAWLAT